MWLLLLSLSIGSVLSSPLESNLNGISFKKNSSNGIYSSERCDFVGNNVKILKMKKEDCIDKCSQMKNCNHYAYNIEKNQCSLKNANFSAGEALSPTTAEGFQCGYKAIPGFKFWKMHYSDACDFWGYNYKTLEGTTPKSCIESCEADVNCSHATWKKRSCKLKKLLKGVKPLPADADNICAKKENFTANWLFRYGYFFSYGCKFEADDDVGSEVFKTGQDANCATKCAKHVSCSHFTWSPADGNCTLLLGLDKDVEPKCDSGYLCGFVEELRNGGEATCQAD